MAWLRIFFNIVMMFDVFWLVCVPRLPVLLFSLLVTSRDPFLKCLASRAELFPHAVIQ